MSYLNIAKDLVKVAKGTLKPQVFKHGESVPVVEVDDLDLSRKIKESCN